MRIAFVSDKGGLEYNEDFIAKKTKGGIHCFALADGIGRTGTGTTAAEYAVKSVINNFEENTAMDRDIMYGYFEKAQTDIIERKNATKGVFATTMAVLLTDGSSAIWGHCGNSRIYRIKKHRIQEVTDDHSVAFRMFYEGKINYSDIRMCPERNMIYSMMGDAEGFNPDISGLKDIGKNSSFLICSDGFWEYVSESFIEWVFKKARSPRECLDLMLEERQKLAPDGADNFSAIIVHI